MHIDQKVTIWTRIKFHGNEDEQEDVKNTILEKLNSGATVNDILDNDEVGDIEFETLYETSEDLTIEQNEGNATIEFYNDEGELIFDNSKKQ